MTEPLWALAAGCVPDVMPWEIPLIAKKGGFIIRDVVRFIYYMEG